MTALASRTNLDTGTNNANAQTGLLAMWDVLNEFTAKPELDIASASTCDIGSMTSNKLRVTGGTMITSFGTVYRGPILLRMMGSLMIVNNRPTMWCPGNLNLFTSPGDVLIAWPKASTSGTSDGWIVMVLMRGTNILGPLEGGTGQSTLQDAFDAMKQQGSSSATGVWEASIDAEAQAGTDATRCVTPANLGATVLGMGQTYQNMLPSRAVNTTYTNSTGRAILISVAGSMSVANAVLTIAINGTNLVYANASHTAGSRVAAQALIPAGHSYAVATSAGVVTINIWVELR